MTEQLFIRNFAYFCTTGEGNAFQNSFSIQWQELTPKKNQKFLVLLFLITRCCSFQATLIHKIILYACPPKAWIWSKEIAKLPRKNNRLENGKPQKVLENLLDLFLWRVRVYQHLTNLKERSKTKAWECFYSILFRDLCPNAVTQASLLLKPYRLFSCPGLPASL